MIALDAFWGAGSAGGVKNSPLILRFSDRKRYVDSVGEPWHSDKATTALPDEVWRLLRRDVVEENLDLSVGEVRSQRLVTEPGVEKDDTLSGPQSRKDGDE